MFFSDKINISWHHFDLAKSHVDLFLRKQAGGVMMLL